MLISESPDGNYRRRKTPGLCLVEALPGEVVALGISMCDTTRDGSRMVGNPEVRAEEQRVTSGELAESPGGTGVSRPISVSEVASDALSVVGLPNST